MTQHRAETSDAADPIAPERKRYFILTPGRSGSTFLSRILAESGAKFYTGTHNPSNAPAKTFEHLTLNKIAYLLEQAHRLQSQHRFSMAYSLYYHKIITFKRFLARRKLKRFLDYAAYYKNTNHLHHAVRVSAHLGYWPVVILNYRNFPTWMGSLYPGQRYRSLAALSEEYNSAMRNGLALLSLFGGCAIGYEELMDPDDTGWAQALGAVTGLDAEVLLSNRARMFRPPGPDTTLTVMDSEAEMLEAKAREFAGRAVPYSRVALQYWGPEPTK